MRLWTFQAKFIQEHFQENDIYYANWQYVSKNWKPVYQWMIHQMKAKDIQVTDHPPVWAWHSCSKWEAPPTLTVASNLLSQGELEDGVVTLELDVPDELVLLSRYSRYCDLFFYANEIPKEKWPDYLDMFKLKPLEEPDNIQAIFPYLKKEWILDIRPLNLEPNHYEFDYDALV